MDSALRCLTEWMPAQRWYASKGRTPLLEYVAEWELPATDGASSMRLLLIADRASGAPVLYQVPLVERRGPVTEGLAGVMPDGTVLVDGAGDPAFTRWLYAQVTRGGRSGVPTAPLIGERAPTAPPTAASASARLLGAEQSNTSIVFRPDGSETAVICKLFRQVHPGVNPDIELQTAIAAAGSSSVPAAIGSLEGTWPDAASSGGLSGGSLAFAQEFLPGVEDAWRASLDSAAQGRDFTGSAAALGRAVADVHVTLARIFPTRVAARTDRAAIAAGWHDRWDTAVAEIPSLAHLAEAVHGAFAAASAADWPELQRVHGDLHLGQVLDVPQRGWVVLDFEGEPLRPMTERRALDIAARDVAGMLRSFDYAAGTVARAAIADEHAHRWAAASRSAFLAGYRDAGGVSVDPVLLRALELDKAVYEAVYEIRNRPEWLPIPLAAVERLTAR